MEKADSPRIAGIILASGMSRRFGRQNKLLADIGGRPVVRRTVMAYLDAGLSRTLVVVGHDSEAVMAALADLQVSAVYNPDFAQGMSRSLKRGVSALPDEVDAAIIGVGDQPLLTAEIVGTLAHAYAQDRSLIVAPLYSGKRGNPVLFDRTLFTELLQVTGDQGGRPVVERRLDVVTWVSIPDETPGMDIDTIEDLKLLDSGA